MIPPPLPSNSTYTSCWCEENIYLLCQDFVQNQSLRDIWDIFAIFISNSNKTVALWYQKAAQSEGDPVVWDYHVVLLLRPRRGIEEKSTGFNENDMSWVYDFDTTLAVPCPGQAYFTMTFPSDLVFKYESEFRVVPAAQFLQYFASDRSHMLLKSKSTPDITQESGLAYLSPPPFYKPICGPLAAEKGVENNLMSDFVCMSSEGYGKVLARSEIEGCNGY